MFTSCSKWMTKRREKRKPSSSLWSRCMRAEQASTEFVGIDLAPMQSLPPPSAEERQKSLPRRFLGRFLSERNINPADNEAEELKKFIKEKGLYNKHQTLAQRRRLKQLLELEEASTIFINPEPFFGAGVEFRVTPKDHQQERLYFHGNLKNSAYGSYSSITGALRDDESLGRFTNPYRSLPELPLETNMQACIDATEKAQTAQELHIHPEEQSKKKTLNVSISCFHTSAYCLETTV